MNARISYVTKVDCEHIKREILWLKLPEYFYHKAYWNLRVTKNTLLHWVFKPLRSFMHTLQIKVFRVSEFRSNHAAINLDCMFHCACAPNLGEFVPCVQHFLYTMIRWSHVAQYVQNFMPPISGEQRLAVVRTITTVVYQPYLSQGYKFREIWAASHLRVFGLSPSA